jgi:hypothetical protein
MSLLTCDLLQGNDDIPARPSGAPSPQEEEYPPDPDPDLIQSGEVPDFVPKPTKRPLAASQTSNDAGGMAASFKSTSNYDEIDTRPREVILMRRRSLIGLSPKSHLLLLCVIFPLLLAGPLTSLDLKVSLQALMLKLLTPLFSLRESM